MGVERAGTIAMVVLGAVLGTAAAPAQTAGALDDGLAACASIAGRSARLACYDNAARRHVPAPPRVASAPTPDRTPEARTRAPRRGTPVAQGFGAEQVKDRRPKSERPVEVTRTTARVVSATDTGVGHWRIALQDGAVWEMTQAESYFQPPKPGDEVRIRRGAVGSYLMDVGRQGSVRVLRIR